MSAGSPAASTTTSELRVEQPGHALAQDHHRLARSDACALLCVAYGGERLDQGRRRERHVSRERIEVSLGQHDVLGERAVHLPSEEAGVTAEVAVATRTGVARATGDDRIEQNRLAGLDARDAVADRLDDAGGF